MRNKIVPGLLFAVLWASGSVAFKFGIKSADPLILAALRFIGTGLLFGPYFMAKKVQRFMPTLIEWKAILIYGLLNTTLTLGAFAAAQQYASAGISMLFIAVTPLVIGFLSALMLKRKLSPTEIAGMVVAFSGLVLAAALDLPKAQIKPVGIVLLLVYVIAYAMSSIYFSKLKISLPRVAFNVWQVFLGGLMLLPISLLFNQNHVHHWDAHLWLALTWMIIALSFIANQLWLYLVKLDTVMAASWLYLVPVLGYVYGYVLLGESITWWAMAGTILVICGLIISRRPKVENVNTRISE
jgi:probable blue pigment (indigoidine) exporter